MVEELMNVRETCRFYAVDVSTLYRGVKDGRFPRPIKVAKRANRWLRSECEAALTKLAQSRGK